MLTCMNTHTCLTYTCIHNVHVFVHVYVNHAPCRYGDYSPITKGEEITAIFVIIVGSASVGFLVGNISSVVNSRHTVRKQRMAQVRCRPCRFAVGMGIYGPGAPPGIFTPQLC